jgi:ankyrin repeat protein
MYSALHIAASTGDLERVESLIELQHVNATQKGSYGTTALYEAALGGRYNVVQYLVDHCQVPLDLCDNNGATALHCATYNGHEDIVEFLLNRGARVDIRCMGETAEDLALTKRIQACFPRHKEVKRQLRSQHEIEPSKKQNDDQQKYSRFLYV